MKIELQEIPIREVVAGYADNAEEGVVGYGGRLNIRPPYQREFVYKGKQRDEVINTVRKKFPLNVMYWAKNPDGNFEVLDGQQRTLSICQYVNGDYSINGNYFHSLTEDQQKDNDLNTQYRKELLETKDPTLYEKRMTIKTRWHRLQLYKIMNKLKNIHEIKHYNCDLCGRVDILEDILGLWENKRKQIEDQSEECIDFVYNLLPLK